MERQNTRKKVPLCSSLTNEGSEIEKKVDEILNVHAEVLRRGRERKEPSENSLSFVEKQQLLFFTKNKNKIEPVKQIKNKDKPIKKQTQNKQKTQHNDKNSQRDHSETVDYNEKNTEKNLSHSQRNIHNQKITHFTQKILQPSSRPPRQYFTIHKDLNQKRKNEGTPTPQVEKEKKPVKFDAKEREREATRLAKEYEEKLRLEQLEIQRKTKEELLRKRSEEKQAKEAVRSKEREAKRVAKEHEEKLRLERMAIEKEKHEEQKRKELEKKKVIAEAKEKQREEQRLLKERKKKAKLERLETQKKKKEELLRKKQQEKQAKLEVKQREREAKRVAKAHEEKLRLERMAIEKEKQEEQKRKELEKKKVIAEAEEKQREEQRLIKEHEKKVRLEQLEIQRKTKEELLRKKSEEKQAKEAIRSKELEAKRVAKEHEGKLRLEQMAIEKEKQGEQKRKDLEKKKVIAEAEEKQREEQRLIKEHEKKVRLEQLEIQRKTKEELLRKKSEEKQAKEAIRSKELEAKRVAKEHEGKLRLERMAIEKEKQGEQKRKDLEKKKVIAEAEEKQREEQRLIKEHEKKVRLEQLEIQRKTKEELLRKKSEEKQAKEAIRSKELEAKRVAKEHEGKLRLEQMAIEKEKQGEQKRKDLEKKKVIAEAEEKQREEETLKELEEEKIQTPVESKKHFGFTNKKKEGEATEVKSVAEKKITTSLPVPLHVQNAFRQQLGEKLQRARQDQRRVPKSLADADRTDADIINNNQEGPLLFEDLVGQVKPDESTWLDERIKSDRTAEDISKNTLQEDSNKVFFDDKSLMADLSAKSEFESPGLTQNLKQNTFNEIIPDGKIANSDVANKLKAFTLEHLGYSQNSVEEIDFYSLQEPFAYVEIIREKESLDKRYVLIEMGLSEEEARNLKFIKGTLEALSFNTDALEVKGDSQYLSEKVDSIISEYMLNIDTLSKEKIMHYLESEAIGLGRLEVLMKDPNIEDISCDGSGVFLFLYHRRYGSLKSNIMFNDDDELSDFVVKLAQKCGKHISISEPMLDATMPDGSRIQMTLSTEVTTKGSTFTIRKFSQNPFSPPDLVEFHTMSSEMVAYMWLAVENGINALIAGGTAAGKTSTLNAIALFIPREKKIVSIEETREINLPHPNWIPGVVRSGFGEVVGNKVIGEIDLYDLMKAALRQRPEYILVGEIRGKEAYVLFQAMATGHTTYSTVHADSAQSLIHRLEGKPIEIPRIMLQTLDIVCIQVISRVKNKRARRVKQIIEIIDIDPTTKEILTNEVFTWDPIEDKFIYSGKSYIIERIRSEKNISREGMIKEIKNRTILLDWMNNNNIREFKKVATLVARYVDNPEDVMKKIGNES